MKDGIVIMIGVKMTFPRPLSLEDFYELRYEVTSRFGEDYTIIELDTERKEFCIGLIVYYSKEEEFLDLDRFYFSLGEADRQRVKRDLKAIFNSDIPRPKVYMLSC